MQEKSKSMQLKEYMIVKHLNIISILYLYNFILLIVFLSVAQGIS